jgi:hypothetical protein
MQRGHFGDVGHQPAAEVAEEDAVDRREILRHVGHDLHGLRPVALRDQIAESHARCQRDAEVDHAIELLGQRDGGEVGQRRAA